MKINDKILSIPPFVSTSWSRITSLIMKGNLLVISLNDGNSLSIPDLPTEIIESIFTHHAEYLEKSKPDSAITHSLMLNDEEQLNRLLEQGHGSIMKFGFGTSDEMGNMMQHNPEQAESPDLPPEVVQKIAAISKILTSEEVLMPKPEPSCNCFHCQIARAMLSTSPITIENAHIEPVVSDAELTFQEWDINQTGDKLFSVTNRLDENEKYNVYLGQPIGCTCGHEGCEHIIAVLKS
ncbi:MAG: hypothetical protein H0W88_10645 [Parachlamydiaceae bacterium]|nr:hypothetical protein [Parachlamydiaceae bacterium]